MGEKKLTALAAQLAKGFKTNNQFCCTLTKLTIETVLSAELANHFRHKGKVPKASSNTTMSIHPKYFLDTINNVKLPTPSNH